MVRQKLIKNTPPFSFRSYTTFELNSLLMLLNFTDGSTFAAGATNYNRAPGTERSTRIVLQVEIGEQLTTAFLDTGKPSLICPPDFAAIVGLTASNGMAETVRIHGKLVNGRIHNVNLTMLADEGVPLYLNGPVFVPTHPLEVDADTFRSFLGMAACLESMCFAVDPFTRIFYFR